MKVLVTGGAGYIGSHIAKIFSENNFKVLVLDDLTNSNTKRLENLDINFVEGSIKNPEIVSQSLEKVDLVIHCAAYKSVVESEINPAKYHEVNYFGTNTLLNEMVKKGVNSIIFASTAAIYGNSVESPMAESADPSPISTYGKTKLKAERLLESYTKNSNLKGISLRFFNAVGAASNNMADTSKDNLFPKVFAAISSKKPAEIYGDDYETPDGSCIRDYIHVQDIAEAHLCMWEYLKKVQGYKVFNIGTGSGYSVIEIMNSIQKITGIDFERVVRPRRVGDLAVAFADTRMINQETGWKARYSLDQMITSAWDAWGSL